MGRGEVQYIFGGGGGGGGYTWTGSGAVAPHSMGRYTLARAYLPMECNGKTEPTFAKTWGGGGGGRWSGQEH